MTDTSADLPDVDEADAIEQAQAADGGLDYSSDDEQVHDGSTGPVARWDADQVDMIEQAQTITSASDEEYPNVDEG
jgi:hypothetical protein